MFLYLIIGMGRATTAFLKGLTRAQIGRTVRRLGPPNVLELSDGAAELALLVDKTNREIVVRIRGLWRSLKGVLADGAFDILCDYMGYYLYDWEGLTAFIELNTEVPIFDEDEELRLRAVYDSEGDISLQSLSPTPIIFWYTAETIWSWMLGTGRYGAPNLIEGLYTYTTVKTCIDKAIEAIEAIDDMTEQNKIECMDRESKLVYSRFQKRSNDMKQQILMAFREAAGWPDFALW